MSVVLSHALLWMLAVMNTLAICFLVRYLASLSYLSDNGLIEPADQPSTIIGKRAPNFYATEIYSGKKTNFSFFRSVCKYIVFLSSDCRGCIRFASELASHEEIEWEKIIFFCQGTERACKTELASVLPAQAIVLSGHAVDITSIYSLAKVPAVAVLGASNIVEAVHYPTSFTDLKDALAPIQELEMHPVLEKS